MGALGVIFLFPILFLINWLIRKFDFFTKKDIFNSCLKSCLVSNDCTLETFEYQNATYDKKKYIVMLTRELSTFRLEELKKIQFENNPRYKGQDEQEYCKAKYEAISQALALK